MTAELLIENLTRSGVRLAVTGDQLKVNAPAGVLTDSDRELLRRHKPALLKLLTGDPRISDQPCPSCGGATLSESGDGWRHRWCPEPSHFDRWDADAGQRLGDVVPGWGIGRRKLVGCLAQHECPECHQAMTLQQREPETYFCPGCRLWSVEGRLQ